MDLGSAADRSATVLIITVAQIVPPAADAELAAAHVASHQHPHHHLGEQQLLSQARLPSHFYLFFW